MSRSRAETLAMAGALALGAAVSLGLSRFSYALLLPPMQSDLGWSYFAGGMLGTLNAAGYLLGAINAVGALARRPARRLFLAGMGLTGVFLVAHGFFSLAPHLAVLRFAAGVAAAATFVAGGFLAAHLVRASGEADESPTLPTLVLSIYYGGTGLGIVVSTLVVPPLAARPVEHAWQEAWVALGVASFVCTALAAWATHRLEPPPLTDDAGNAPFRRRRLGFALAAYALFGVGYIGYMTFIVSLLAEQGVGRDTIVAFYGLLGAAVMVGAWIWAPLLRRFRGGGAMALLDALLVVATALPLASRHPAAVIASGLLFGGVFLSVVASTTALVRHNLPPAQWGHGIAAFTIAFATGQIVGPGLVGAVADAFGGLRPGLGFSAAVLALAALLAALQRPLPRATAAPR